MSSTHELPGSISSPPAPPTAIPESAPIPSDSADRSAGHSMFVGAIMAILVLATLAMISFIWYRAYGVREPTSAVYVIGDEMLAGTVVTISALGTDREPIVSALDTSNGYSVSALVEPGIYSVTARRGDLTLLRTEVEVMRFFGPRFELAAHVKQAIAEGKLAPLEPLPSSHVPPPTSRRP